MIGVELDKIIPVKLEHRARTLYRLLRERQRLSISSPQNPMVNVLNIICFAIYTDLRDEGKEPLARRIMFDFRLENCQPTYE